MLEDRIAGLEKREKELGELLADPGIFKDKGKGLPLLDEYGQVKKELEDLMLKWEENQNRLEELKKEFGIDDQA